MPIACTALVFKANEVINIPMERRWVVNFCDINLQGVFCRKESGKNFDSAVITGSELASPYPISKDEKRGLMDEYFRRVKG
jgi:hypothetical protein